MMFVLMTRMLVDLEMKVSDVVLAQSLQDKEVAERWGRR
jgi:hypothetical protein